MTIKPNDFYTKMNELCNDNVRSLFKDLTDYFLSSIKMENTDDIEYDFNHFDKRFYMSVIGKEDCAVIRIHPEGIPKGDAVIYVEYRTRRHEFENGKRIPVFDAGQWEMNSDSCRVIEFVRCKTLAHADVVREIMLSHK